MVQTLFRICVTSWAFTNRVWKWRHILTSQIDSKNDVKILPSFLLFFYKHMKIRNHARLCLVIFDFESLCLDVHKRCPQSGRGGLSSADIFRTRSSSDAGVCTFWCKKLQILEIYGVSARTGLSYGVSARTSMEGVESVRHFTDKGRRGSIFRDFMRASFMDSHLTFKV